jgi:hypothetical protein
MAANEDCANLPLVGKSLVGEEDNYVLRSDSERTAVFAFVLWQLTNISFVAGRVRPGDRALGERAGMLKSLERR